MKWRELEEMKATGIVRRIDDLGRVVVPKEIRRTLGIREGTPLEIFTGQDGEVILKKYSPLGEIHTFAQHYAESLAQASGILSCITDMEKVIAASGSGRKETAEQELAEEFVQLLEERKPVAISREEASRFRFLKGRTADCEEMVISPVISGGDVIGGVLLIRMEKEKGVSGEICQKLAQCAAVFLGSQMEP